MTFVLVTPHQVELYLKIKRMHDVADLLKEETNHDGSKNREMSNVEHDRRSSDDDSATERRFNKGSWSQEEDDLLKAYVQKHGEGNWKSVQKHSGLSRCGKSCRLRWMNHLKPDLKKGAFTQEEQDRILELHVLHGNKWAVIAAQLPGRTDNEIKNYWNTRAKRLQRLGLPLYPEGVQERVSNATAQSGVNIDVHQAQEDYSEAERFDLPIPHFERLPISDYPSLLSTLTFNNRFTMPCPSSFQNTYNSIASSNWGPETSVPFTGGYTMNWQSLLLGNQFVQNIPEQFMDRHLFGNATTYPCPFEPFIQMAENLEFPSIQCSNYHQVPNSCGAQQSNSMQVLEEQSYSMLVLEEQSYSMQVLEEQSYSMQVLEEQCDSMQVLEEKSDSLQVLEEQSDSMQFLEEQCDLMLVLEEQSYSMQVLEEPSDTMLVLEEQCDSMLVREGQSNSMVVLEEQSNSMQVLEEQSNSMLGREEQPNSKPVIEESDNVFLHFPLIDQTPLPSTAFDAIISATANITGECFDFDTMLDYGCSLSSNDCHLDKTTSLGG